MLAVGLRWLYSLSLILGLPLVLLRLWWKGRHHPGYRRRIGERFGFVQLPAPGSRRIWVHAVSVGEVQAALPLVQALNSQHAGCSVLLTTTTATGAEHARRQFGDRVAHSYFPYDVPDAVARFLARARPALLILMETELWPNLLHACKDRGVPVLLANARLSSRSLRRYLWLRPLVRAMLQDVQAVAAQTPADAERFVALGLPRAAVEVIGSLKFDVRLPEDLPARIEACRRDCAAPRPLWLAASTHAGEETIVLDAHMQLLRECPDALLILAPRHPARAADIAALVRQRGLKFKQRSRGEACDPATQVYLLDTLGELLPFYGVADVAFVGGSLVPVGGHNLLEPASVGTPILTGPHVFNFAEIGRLLNEAGAARVVADAGTLAGEVAVLLGDPGVRAQRVAAGRGVVQAHSGATARLLRLIEPMLR